MQPTASCKSCTVVIPTYNSAPMLGDLIAQLEPVLATAVTQFEVILVNDDSPDNTWEVIRTLAGEKSWVHGINLMRNYGQHNALLCGIRAARYECIVTMDDDLQNPPDQIPKMLSKLAEGYDVVYGTPHQGQHGLLRNLASKITKLALQSAMGAKTAQNISAFRVFRAHLRDAFQNYGGPFVSIDVLLTWGTTRFTAIDVEHQPRRIGKSNYTLRMLIVHTFNMMTGFSTLPLQLASWLGFFFAFFGILVLIWVIGRFIVEGGSPPGFPFLASIIAVFSGAQLFALGIIGEYLARMHFRMMDRPPFAARETVGFNEMENPELDQ